MFRVTRALRLTAGAFVVAGGLIVASCSSGTVQTTPASSAATPTAAVTQSIPAGGGTLTLASSATNVAQMTFAAGGSGSITAQGSTTAPAGAPAVTSLKRTTQANVVGGVPFFYVTFTVSTTVAASLIAGESVTLSGQPATATYGVEFADITSTPATSLGDAGPGTLANNVVTITNGTSTNPPSLLAGHTYLLMFFYVPAGTVQPSASPSASATATASAAPTASPSGSAIPNYIFGSQSTPLTEDSTNCTINVNCANGGGNVPLFIRNGGIAISFGVPSATIPISLYSVTSTANITPSGFPTLTNAQFYLEFISQNDVGGNGFQNGTLTAATATFPQTPDVLVTATAVTNVTAGCALWVLTTTNNVVGWTQIAPATGVAALNVGLNSYDMLPVTIPNGTVDIATSGQYLAIACH